MTLCVLSYFLQHHLAPQPARLKYVGANDELLLEDQMQRITLTGNISPKELVTGEGEEGEGERGREGEIGKRESLVVLICRYCCWCSGSGASQRFL